MPPSRPVSAGPGIRLQHLGGRTHIALEGGEGFWAELTLQTTVTRSDLTDAEAFDWVEQIPYEGGTWLDKPEGRRGYSNSKPAFDPASPDAPGFEVGDVVWLVPGYAKPVGNDPPTDEDWGTEYLIAYAGSGGAAAAVVRCGSTSRALADAGDTTSGSAVVTGLASTAALGVGMPVYGAGIPAGATIQSIDSATQVTLSAAAAATGSGVALTFADYFPATLQDYDADADAWSDGPAVYLIDANAPAAEAATLSAGRRYVAVRVGQAPDGADVYAAETSLDLDACNQSLDRPEEVAGYNAVAEQLLGHGADGCWAWNDVEECADPAGATGTLADGSEVAGGVVTAVGSAAYAQLILAGRVFGG